MVLSDYNLGTVCYNINYSYQYIVQLASTWVSNKHRILELRKLSVYLISSFHRRRNEVTCIQPFWGYNKTRIYSPNSQGKAGSIRPKLPLFVYTYF